jgi:hypothetical protein
MKQANLKGAEDEVGYDEDVVTQVRLRGPLEVGQWPENLRARIVQSGALPHVLGYDVEQDLARYYGWLDVLFLSLTGELPTAAVSSALNVISVFLTPVSAATASSHAAVLARLCGASPGATLGVAAIALGEWSRQVIDSHLTLLKWCKSKDQEPPVQFCSTDGVERASVERLRKALVATGLIVPELDVNWTRNAALIVALYACGFREPSQLEVLITTLRMPCVIAEAMSQKMAEFSKYPIHLPRFEFEE